MSIKSIIFPTRTSLLEKPTWVDNIRCLYKKTKNRSFLKKLKKDMENTLHEEMTTAEKEVHRRQLIKLLNNDLDNLVSVHETHSPDNYGHMQITLHVKYKDK